MDRGFRRLYSRLAEHAPELVHFSVDREARLERLSRSLAARLGVAEAAARGRPVAAHLAVADASRLASLLAQPQDPLEPILLNLLDPDGNPFTVRAMLASTGEELRVAGVLATDDVAEMGKELLRLNNELAASMRESLRRGRELAATLEALRQRNAELSEAMKTIEQLARIDPLTGLANRRALSEALPREMERSSRTGSALSVVVLDFDHFKQVNDALGHSAGDRLLAAVGHEVAAQVRKCDLAVRLGGDEFLLLLPGASLDQAALAAERLRSRVAALSVEGVPEVHLSAGATVYLAPESETDLIARADRALYEAKAGGRNAVVCAGPPFSLPVLHRGKAGREEAS